MSAVDEFASDLAGITADIDASFKVLNQRKANLKDRGAKVAAGWSKYFDAQNAAITAAEDALNRISNVPLSDAAPVKPAVQAISTVPPLNAVKM